MIFVTKIKKITRYNFSYREVMLGKCFDKNLATQIQDFFVELQEHNIKNVLLIFSQVESIDSTGIGLLVNSQEELSQHGLCLKFVGVSSKILHLFEILGLVNFFPIYPTTATALASFFAPQDQTFFSNSDWENGVVQITETKKNNEEVPSIPSLTTNSTTPKEISTPIEIIASNEGQLLLPDSSNPKPSTSEEISPEENVEASLPKRMHTIKIKKRDNKPEETSRVQYLLKVEYIPKMICGQEFPLRILLIGPTKKKEKTWEIIPKICGCLVTPPRINLHDAELPMEFIFSVIPMARNKGASEILIFAKRSPLRQFVLHTACTSSILPTIFSIASATVMLFTILCYSWEISKISAFDLWFQGILWSSILALGALLTSYRLHPHKTSNQFSFYEKGEE